MVDGKAYAILTGHLHHNKIDSDGGIVTAMAGSFEGVDTYCAGRRILSKPEQLVLVVDRFGIRSAEFVDLKEDMKESEQW